MALVLLAGCIGGYTDPGVEQGGIEIAPNAELTTNDSGFFVENASIHFTLHAEQKETFDHIMLCLYTGDGDVLGSTDLGPFTAPTSIQGVRIRFIDDEGATMKTIHLGTMNASRWTANFSTQLDDSPERVLLLVKNVTDPGGRPPYTIVGLQRDDSGNYVPYHDYEPNS